MLGQANQGRLPHHRVGSGAGWLARRLIPGLASRSLDALAQYFGVTNVARHRAAGDALATAKVLSGLLERAADRGIQTVAELERLSARPRRKRSAMPTSMVEL